MCSPSEQEVESWYYFDIMLLGSRGVGKTTTADKIIVANPGGESLNFDLEDSASTVMSDTIQYHDLSMWHASEDPARLEKVKKRLATLKSVREGNKTHENLSEIDRDVTDTFELLCNDTSRVRVLDVPGFYSPNSWTSRDSDNSVSQIIRNDLSTMRKILHIKMAKKFKFNRIVYFLPETGVLSRSSESLRMELAIMKNYFGTSIFKCMVVAATYSRSAYAKFNKRVELYTSEEKETTRQRFHETLRNVLGRDKVPEPPVIFLSLRDSCDETLRKIKESEVPKEGVHLQFNPSTCARCGINIGRLKERGRPTTHSQHGGRGATAASDEVVSIASNGSWLTAMPYKDSTCHPKLVSKYSTTQKVVGEVVQKINFRGMLGEKWPQLSNADEICVECHQPPHAVGCHLVRTTYVDGDTLESIYVDHKSAI